MTMRHLSTAADWEGIRLVVFDVDGTLYRQRPLRLRMALELLSHVLSSGDVTTLRVLNCYRRVRERMAEEEVMDFVPALLGEAARACGTSDEHVRSIVAEWIERRPLRHLGSCRYPGLVELFAALRRRRKSIGVLSDYAVPAKLQALGLVADYVVCAEDAEIGVLKPNPKGLSALIRAAGVTPETTLLVGDRPERDGLAARRIGARAMIRSERSSDDWQTFRTFDDASFTPILKG